MGECFSTPSDSTCIEYAEKFKEIVRLISENSTLNYEQLLKESSHELLQRYRRMIIDNEQREFDKILQNYIEKSKIECNTKLNELKLQYEQMLSDERKKNISKEELGKEIQNIRNLLKEQRNLIM